jgi:hypothetical protein
VNAPNSAKGSLLAVDFGGDVGTAAAEEGFPQIEAEEEVVEEKGSC